MAWTRFPLEDLAELADLHRRLKSRRIDLLRAGREEQVDAGLLGEVHVPLEIARIALQVFSGPELRGVDEEACDRHVALAGAGPKERQVSFVEGAHGRHQTDAHRLLARGHERFADARHAADQLHGRVAFASARYSGATSGARSSRVRRWLSTVS